MACGFFERAVIPPEKRRPTFLWIDEASEYFDDKIDDLLIQARKFRLGLVIAHQYLKQLERNLTASVMTNTSIKLVGRVSHGDARVIAPEMHVSPDLFADIRKHEDRAEFALFVRNHTPRAIHLTIPFGTAEGIDRMSDDSFDILLNASRRKLSSAYHARTGTDSAGDETESEAHDPEPTDDDFPSAEDSHFERY